MSISKKQKERTYLDSFLYFCPDLPAGKIDPDESPDFIIRTDQCQLGIKITEIFVDHGGKRNSRQGIAAARHRITDIARDAAIKSKTPPASVTLFFNWTQPLLRQNEPTIAEAVEKVVHDNMPPAGENAELECWYGSIQPTEVDLILINRAYPVDEHQWSWTEASRVEKNAIPHIELAIRKKIDVYARCLKKCNECWLLIVAPSPNASGGIRPDEASLSHTYRSPFDRTYVFDDTFGCLHRLNTLKFEE
jgi:hypothetical protein